MVTIHGMSIDKPAEETDKIKYFDATGADMLHYAQNLQHKLEENGKNQTVIITNPADQCWMLGVNTTMFSFGRNTNPGMCYLGHNGYMQTGDEYLGLTTEMPLYALRDLDLSKSLTGLEKHKISAAAKAAEQVVKAQERHDTELFFGHVQQDQYYGIIEDLNRDESLVRQVDKYGKTALYYAQSIEVVKLLINQGVNPNALDNEGKRALDCANNPAVKMELEQHTRVPVAGKWTTKVAVKEEIDLDSPAAPNNGCCFSIC